MVWVVASRLLVLPPHPVLLLPETAALKRLETCTRLLGL